MSQLYKNLLIVCEGEATETTYLHQFRDLIIEKDSEFYIEILPKEEPDKTKKRKQRKNSDTKHIDPLIVETVNNDYTAQPTRYVREAQIGIEDNTYAEVWAVFDKDGHPNHEEAFNLATNLTNGKKVNIAFNSIAFEYWILLHFEDNPTPFEKAMCRIRLGDGKKEYFYCGTHSKADDCSGVKCVCGRIVEQNFLEYINRKKEFDYSKYGYNVKQAILRAIGLRKIYKNTLEPVYELNPYTTMDRLVFKLMNLPNNNFIWFDLNESQLINNEYSVSIVVDNTILKIRIDYDKELTFIFRKDFVCLIDIDGNIVDIGQRHVFTNKNPHEFEFDLNSLNPSPPILYFGLKTKEKEYLISELI